MTVMSHLLPRCRAVAGLLAAAWLAGCAPTQFEAASEHLPTPLIDRIPVAGGGHLPAEFRDKVYAEKR